MPRSKKLRVKVELKKAKSAKKMSAQKAQKKEVSLIGQALRSLGGLGGGAIGGMFGSAGTGSNVGTSLGATISKWLGAGDYSVRQNSIVSSSLRGSSSIPMMHNVGQSITIRHKEYVCQVKSSVGFKVQRFFLLQPGDTNTFPWLSGVAVRFQQYRIKGMVFHYVPTSGYAVSGTNPALGAVMMQTSYRANDSDPGSKVELLNEYWASESVPADSFCHPIECAPQENPFQVHYVRSKPVPTGDSPMLYDIGKTYVATMGMPADDNIVGDLWVTYEIELMKPQLESSVLSTIASSFATGLGTIAPTTPLGSLDSIAVGTLPFAMAGKTIEMPIGLLGNYIFTVRVRSSAASFTTFDTPGAPTYVNCVGWPVSPGGQLATWNRLTAGAGVLESGYYQFAIRITDPSSKASVTLPTFSWTATTTLSVEVGVAEM